VVEQIEIYTDLLKKHQTDIVDAYRRHCADMLKSDCISRTSNRREYLARVIESGIIELDPNPRLVVFGFDADQKPGPGWKEYKDKLQKLLPGRMFLKGTAKDFVRGVRFRERGHGLERAEEARLE
jgi:hypothetical protein